MTTSAASTPSLVSPPAASSENKQKALAYLRRAIEKMKALQAAERVLANIERVLLSRAPGKFDLAPLVAAINELNLALRNKDEDKAQEAMTAVGQALEAATQSLVARDTTIMPYHLRRYCEDDNVLLDLNALAALTSFYRSLPSTDANRGKYDYVVTRLFSQPEPGCSTRLRQLRISREQLTKRLTEMCLAWGETIVRAPEDAEKIRQHIQHFDEFITEVKQISKFEELINSAFFQRVRACKAQVGNLLYLPEISAVSIESNVIINNRFLTLLERESEAATSASPALQNLADAFGAPYSNEPDEISVILRELQASAPSDEAAQAPVARLTNSIQLPLPLEAPPEPATAPDLPPPAPTDEAAETAEVSPAAVAPEDFVPAEPAAVSEMDEELQALAVDPDNQPLVAAYYKASPEARKLNLHNFLAALPDGDHAELASERKSRRKALSLILQADQIVQPDLSEEAEPIADLEARAEKLLDQLGQISDEIRDQIKVAAKYEQNANNDVLLDVYNQLMTVRLRLQSVLIRRSINDTADTISPAPAPTQRAAEVTAVVVKNTASQPGTQKMWRNGLIVAVMAALLIALGVHFGMSRRAKPKDDPAVVRLDRSQLPHGDFFTEVKLHQELMICMVTQRWLEMAASEQKVKLREIFNYGQERGVNRIILLAPKGTTVGFVTKDDIYVN
jgi:hypothetical protein